MTAKHARFFARTVMVKNKEFEIAYRALDRVMRNDQIQERWRRNLYYEKPFQTRQRLSYEKVKRIYDSDMKRKIEFLMRKNRVEPWIR